MTTSKPTPLLSGRLAQEAHDVLSSVSRALLAMPLHSMADPSLARGLSGLALAHSELAKVFPDAAHGAHTVRALDRAIALLGTGVHSPSLFHGFTGVAWTAAHLGRTSAADHAEIEHALVGYLSRTPWTEPYDLMDGLVGVGVYALERMPGAMARRLVELVVARLADTARARSLGHTWQSHRKWVPRPLQRFPQPVWNLGLAHGVPGVIAVLAGACAHGVARVEARRLLDGAVRWLLANELDAPHAGFAMGLGPHLPRRPTRAAWCYGDPGVATALLVAARAVGSATWKREALRIALRAAARPSDDCHVDDAGLCHGAAGLGHLFHRMYTATGEARLADAAAFWLGRAMSLRRPESGVGGFLAWRPAGARSDWHPDPGFLLGAAGTSLALAAGLSTREPTWDRVLLASLPPAA